MTELRNDRHLSVHDLRRRINEGDIDTVVVAFTDMQGRLQGKRMHAVYFADHVLEHGTEGCNYLLAVDIEMNTVDGLRDLVLGPGLRRLRVRARPADHPAAAAPAGRRDGAVRPGVAGPHPGARSRRGRSCRPSWTGSPSAGMVALAGTELEFIAFHTSYEDAARQRYHDLVPVNAYNVDYSILGGARAEPLLREIRNTMYAAGLDVESAKGECNFGQHEIGFLYADALTTADNHAVYKTVAKEIAAQQGRSITFLAKYNEREGSSCHIHLSLRGADGSTVFWGDGRRAEPVEGRTPLYDSFVAGLLATMADFTLLYAPNINSYKRFAPGSFAPTTIAWGTDNRTCALRLVGHGPSARLENRVPGADVNPYLALAAMLAGGLYGIENDLELGPELTGNAYTSGLPTVPRTLRDAREAWAGSTIARAAFGDDIVDHYTNMADVELAAFDAAVTDWELRRGFERM